MVTMHTLPIPTVRAASLSGLGPLARLLEQAEADHGGLRTEVGFTF